ncbi:hypothetical protein DPMN_161001 [Dreissena polymorpha]|uniref:Uncharacterized protein n=1 Tax=Dreissena polymorpha TaxID=45954 RepID=A0A9D4EPK8_DREPO|nr:hypothetical protein DPMN_161001 [Dreissena polymorpha]
MLRPNSLRPFSVDKDAFTVKIWFMPAIPIESVKLPTAENVKSITVEFVRPDKNATTVLAAQVHCVFVGYCIFTIYYFMNAC